MCEGRWRGREGRKNEAVNGAPCHQRYGKKHRMNWKNERKVQKGAEGKEKTGPTTCLSLALSLSPCVTLFSFTPLLTHRQTFGEGGVHRACFSDRHERESVASAGFQAHCHPAAPLTGFTAHMGWEHTSFFVGSIVVVLHSLKQTPPTK